MLWIWSVPEKFPNKKMGEYVKGSGTDRFVFREGRELTEQVIPPKIVFECLEKHLNDVLPNSGLLLIVSKKVIEILEGICPQDIQVFKANVYVGEKRIPHYYLLNIVNAVEVVDKDKSEYTTIKGTEAILNFKKIVYKFGVLPNNHHIVRNLDYKSHVLVSDDLRDVFERHSIKGVQFI
ncbi:imm11 family protein [Saccharibacillus kuerlensis]|uniref:Immunity MXAN-0049 protein domain-containing protein n=1 Tax=Saccharibacillus kuerlensis TaxID=459527 RepID=A0ABQ2L2E9_9BACL|nr:DUF1629 domain-containing protein [Saccharibacillus kuerlensis]GGO00195.1 hypothetical protein GCM10010969_21090 [Saccharibacillus kuerlensis]